MTGRGALAAMGAIAFMCIWPVFARWPWVPMGLTGAALLVWVSVLPLKRRQRRQLERFMTDKCLACGYDLRGIGRSGRCPECGLAFEDVSPPSDEGQGF